MLKWLGLRTAIIVLGVLVGLIAAETLTRALPLAINREDAFDHHAPDPYLPFRPKPSSRFTGRTNEFDYDYRHNSVGFRDVERRIAKEPGTFRILGLGDSFTYGAGVAFEETYLYRLESMLNARAGAHPRVEIVKAGVSRYFPEPERMLLEAYGVQYEPDLIVVGFLPNDVVDTFMGLTAVTVDRRGYLVSREAAELASVAHQIYRHSRFGRLFLKAYVDWQIQKRYPVRWSEISRDGGFHEKDWVRVEHEYERMLAIARSIGARLLIFHLPQRGPWDSASRYPATRLSAWAARREAHFLDVLPAMERRPTGERLYYERDGHCTAAGHGVIAQELYRYVTDQGLVR